MSDVQAVDDVGGDSFLRGFAKAAQKTDFSMSITLGVRGAIVTGMLIGRDKWLEELSAALSAAGEVGQGLGDGLREGFREADLQQPADQEVFYGFLHLKDAQYVLGGSSFAPTTAGFLWRGRISEISAWSLGSLASGR
jgi:hypothetical protein